MPMTPPPLSSLNMKTTGRAGKPATVTSISNPWSLKTGRNEFFEIESTTVVRNTDTVDLTRVTELRDPINIVLPTNRTVRTSLIVWDRDKHNSHDFVRAWTDVTLPSGDLEVSETAIGTALPMPDCQSVRL